MRIFYFNDRPLSVRVFIGDLTGDGYRLEAHSGTWFKVEMLEDKAPFFKVWDDIVLIGTIGCYKGS
jgi:hypothetical protein